MFCEPDWDDEVDVVCTDTGLAGLATAIAAVEQDGEVFLATAPSPTDADRGWFDHAGDEDTVEYLGQLTADLDVAGLRQLDPDLPVRLMSETTPARGRMVPPFEGPRLREWAAVCVPSPSGYLYTQVTDWTSTTLDGGDGDLFKVTEIGVMAPDPDDTVGSVHDWLSDEARDRDIFPNPVTRFERLVFEDGVVTGAVFGTESGPLTVRARHGVLICRNGIPARGASLPNLPGHAPLRVALVGKEASRFGRVELLTSDSAVAQVCPLHSSRPAAPEVRTSRS
ncbi:MULTISPECIES: FAD-binding protein [Mycolicibacterium]|uniref:FAD-binding protein n=1 Tax=Mycolicibacterium TaxID=1866885 RepID=UPI00298C5920|nr:FAD-binding protein [Mycolicibacterium sp. D5.8-2]MDW5610726.1 FAD-binding protein [Mycolicibacterium sp. D5.8-2]